jgi:hypothetical protein
LYLVILTEIQLGSYIKKVSILCFKGTPCVRHSHNHFVGLTLLAKHRAEEYIWKTGLDYTIVRPGGLDRGPAGSIVLGKEDTIFGGSVPREQVKV